MLNDFNFELSEYLKQKFPNEIHDYHAQQIDKDTYKISWVDDKNPSPFAYYETKEVEDRIYNKDWIIKV